jgi:hypothetical protein
MINEGERNQKKTRRNKIKNKKRTRRKKKKNKKKNKYLC